MHHALLDYDFPTYTTIENCILQTLQITFAWSCENVVMAMTQVDGKGQKFDLSPRQIPFADLHIWQAWLRHGHYLACEIISCSLHFQFFCYPYTWFCHPLSDYSFWRFCEFLQLVLQPTPVNRVLLKIHVGPYVKIGHSGQWCAFRGSPLVVLIFRPFNCRKTGILGTDFDFLCDRKLL